MSTFPAWRFSPDGEERLFETEADVPKGWLTRHTPETVARMNGWATEAPAKVVKVEKIAGAEKFDKNGDGRVGGSAAPEKTDRLKELRAEYQALVGKRAFPGWDEAEIERRMAAHKPVIDETEF